MKQSHPIQLQILKKLLFVQSLRYSALKPSEGMENNQFDFYLDQLIEQKYVQKGDDGYLLTFAGKEYANRMDTDAVTIKPQAKIGAIVCPIRTTKTGTEYLIYTRLKQPFYGCQGFMSGKVSYGEKITEAAERELEEETGLKGKAKLIRIKHFRVFDKPTNSLVEDKLFFFCLVKNAQGKIIANKEGNYEWVKEADLFTYVTNHFESLARFKEDIEMIKNHDGQIKFEELDHFTDKF